MKYTWDWVLLQIGNLSLDLCSRHLLLLAQLIDGASHIWTASLQQANAVSAVERLPDSEQAGQRMNQAVQQQAKIDAAVCHEAPWYSAAPDKKAESSLSVPLLCNVSNPVKSGCVASSPGSCCAELTASPACSERLSCNC